MAVCSLLKVQLQLHRFKCTYEEDKNTKFSENEEMGQ
jgi:hypothetical protein